MWLGGLLGYKTYSFVCCLPFQGCHNVERHGEVGYAPFLTFSNKLVCILFKLQLWLELTYRGSERQALQNKDR
jgi:hypothetical protein